MKSQKLEKICKAMKCHFLLLFLLPFCASQKHESNTEKEMPYCWLNTKYIECLKSKLPCECEKNVETYYSLVIDTNSSSKNFGVALSKYDFLEPNVFPINKIGQHEYAVFSKPNDTTSIWAKIFIKTDSICFIENNSQSVFCKTNNSNKYDVQHYKFDNVDLLNNTLSKKGHPKLEEIVNSDSLTCYCNKWKGKVNFLHSLKLQSWILEIKNDSLFIDLVTYPGEDPDPDDPIIRQKFKAINFN